LIYCICLIATDLLYLFGPSFGAHSALLDQPGEQGSKKQALS
jgi:hypothetical protein